MSYEIMKFEKFIDKLGTINEVVWLGMPKKGVWIRESDAIVIFDEYGEEELEDASPDGTLKIAGVKNMEITVNTDIIEEILYNLQDQNSDIFLDFDIISKAIQYYHQHDAFIDVYNINIQNR